MIYTGDNCHSLPCHYFNSLLRVLYVCPKRLTLCSSLNYYMSENIRDKSQVLKSNKKGLKTKWILYFCLIVVCIALITLFARPCPEGYLTTSLERAGRISSLQDSILKYNEATQCFLYIQRIWKYCNGKYFNQFFGLFVAIITNLLYRVVQKLFTKTKTFNSFFDDTLFTLENLAFTTLDLNLRDRILSGSYHLSLVS